MCSIWSLLILTHCWGSQLKRRDVAFGGKCIREKQPGHFLHVEHVKILCVFQDVTDYAIGMTVK